MLGGTLSLAFCWRCWLGYERFEKAMLIIIPLCLFKAAVVGLLGFTPFLPAVALPLEITLTLFLLTCWWRCSKNTYYSWVTAAVRVPIAGFLLLSMMAQVVYAVALRS